MENPKQDHPKPRMPPLVKILRPSLRYSFQLALANLKPRIYFINPETNDYFDGALNVDMLYLTFTPPPTVQETTQKSFGLIPGPSVRTNSKSGTRKIDATLFFSYPNDDLYAGYDEKTGITFIVIRTWHDAEAEKWKKIAQKAASGFVVFKKGIYLPTILVSITSSVLPSDPDAPRQYTLPNKYPDCQDAVSNQLIPLPKDYDYNE